jgi:hypothetical protein
MNDRLAQRAREDERRSNDLQREVENIYADESLTQEAKQREERNAKDRFNRGSARIAAQRSFEDTDDEGRAKLLTAAVDDLNRLIGWAHEDRMRVELTVKVEPHSFRQPKPELRHSLLRVL